jgi:hypothetical protein
MSTIAERTPTMSGLSARDPNLAFLATRAAVELDRVLQGKQTGIQARAELATRLRNSAEALPESQGPKGLWEPSTISLIHRAVKAEGTNVSTLDELNTAALVIAQRLETSAEVIDDKSEDLKRLRAFCVELANSAVAYERSQIDSSFERVQWG